MLFGNITFIIIIILKKKRSSGEAIIEIVFWHVKSVQVEFMISRSKVGSLGSQLGRCPEKQSCSRCEGLMDAVGRKGSWCFAIDRCVHPLRDSENAHTQIGRSWRSLTVCVYFLTVPFFGWLCVVPRCGAWWAFPVWAGCGMVTVGW